MPTSWKVDNVMKCQEEYKNKIPEKKKTVLSPFTPLKIAREKNGKCEF